MVRDPYNAVAIIPARMGSTRFPGKALADETGKPMVVHVCERASEAHSVQRVVVATDSQEIIDAVRAHGFEAVMTSAEHTNGTSRLGEACKVLGLGDEQMVINVQGDEPEIEPPVIDASEHAALFADEIGVGTVVSPISSDEDFENPNVVKAVLGDGICAPSIPVCNAIYFSRSPIPFPRNTPARPAFRHVGIYAYSVASIRAYLGLASGTLEQTESLEQLRWLEHGFGIQAAVVDSSHTGIDTPEQYRAFVDRWNAKN